MSEAGSYMRGRVVVIVRDMIVAVIDKRMRNHAARAPHGRATNLNIYLSRFNSDTTFFLL
jgi:hypothetical protein